MAITTLEDALVDLGKKLPTVAQDARQAIAQGDGYDVTITLRPGKGGSVAAMHGHSTTGRRSFGRLIRLQ